MPTILVVDDNLAVRTLLSFALKKEGFTVLSAANGSRAIELFSEHAGAIDWVLLDLDMPGISGEQTLRALRKIDPAVRCYLLTGDSSCSSAAIGALGVITKPIIGLELLCKELHGVVRSEPVAL